MLTNFVRRVRAAATGDAGMSLVELLVTIVIVSILGAATTVYFVGSENGSNRTIATTQASAGARVTLDSWTSLLRVADWLDTSTQTDRFEEITPTKIVFYADLNNRPTDCTQVPADCQLVNPPTKVALMLQTTNQATGEGQLVQIIFKSDNTTAQSVTRLALNVTPTDGQPIFQPYLVSGGSVDVAATLGCVRSATLTAGLCLDSPPAGAGMIDPTLATGSNTPTSGQLRANPATASTVNTTLQNIGGITIAFTASDPDDTTSVDFTSSAAVNSGFPS
jgi:prepilin-type N-terminal cleavage/methylation domain-containing protein